MSARSMCDALIPVGKTGIAFRVLNENTTRWFFGLGKNGQMWVDIENPERELPFGLGLPAGVVTAIGQIEEKKEWVFKYEDSNELE